jgi:F0F1-type ATP synthase membrane subunit c/vacuolar-type H+-ATPase subunit K
MGLVKAIVFLMIGVGLLVASVANGMAIRGFVGRSASAPGVVSHLNAGGSHPEIEFTTSSGEKISYPQGGLIFGYRPGQSVRVLYSQENPRGTARVDAFGALWFTPLMLFGLGLALIIGGVASLVSVAHLRSP